MKTKSGTRIEKPSSAIYVVMWFSVLCTLLAKTKPQTTGKKSILIFRVPDACVKGKKYVEFVNLSGKSECFEFKWKMLAEKESEVTRVYVNRAS